MQRYVSGPLLRVIKVSKVAWYVKDGVQAYIEIAQGPILGQLQINGTKVMNLFDDGKQEMSLNIQKKMAEHGVLLDQGWSCNVLAIGTDIESAFESSTCRAVRHDNGWLQVHLVGDQWNIVVHNETRWTVGKLAAHTILAEWVYMWDGWFPVQNR